jgi:hypothetical protein
MEATAKPDEKYCDVCKRGYPRKNWSHHGSSLKHKNNVKASKGQQKVPEKKKCSMCNFTTSYVWNLRRHEQGHANIKQEIKYQFHCTVCDVPIRDAAHKQKHISVSSHTERIVKHHPEYIKPDHRNLSHPGIDPTKTFAMFIEKISIKTRIPRAKKVKEKTEDKKSEKEIHDEEKEEINDELPDIEFLADEDAQTNLLEMEDLFPAIVAKLRREAESEHFNFNTFMDYDNWSKEYDTKKLTEDEIINFIHVMALALDEHYQRKLVKE